MERDVRVRGSFANVSDLDTEPREANRADVLEFNPDGTAMRIYASGIRNCVGEASSRDRRTMVLDERAR